MGMYTELVLACRIKDGPAVPVLQHMTSKDKPDQYPGVLPDHPFFKTSRWSWMFQSASYYFVPMAMSAFEKDLQGGWNLVVRCDFKNYDNEIELLINWLTPYVDSSGLEMIGYHRYEEHDYPTIIRA